MRPKQLYKHIETIYNHFDDFKSKVLIDNFIIIKRDNYYQGLISVTDNLKLQFKISLIHPTDDKAYYKLYYEIVKNVRVGTKMGEETESYEITGEIPQSFLNLFNPTLRELKIKMIMNDNEDSTQTIFEHSI
jgi:hypothetical protein